MSAEDRREQVIRAAVIEFSIRGLEGTSTADIAKRVGVSQPYLFRLFPTKKDLFIAACVRGAERVRDTFVKAAEGKYGYDAICAIGEAYQDLIDTDRSVLMMQHQQYAACHDPDIQAAVRRCMQDLWQLVENLTGEPLEVRVFFFAKGMLCNTIAAMGRDDGSDPMWNPVLDVLRSNTAHASPQQTEKDYAEYVMGSFIPGVATMAGDPEN